MKKIAFIIPFAGLAFYAFTGPDVQAWNVDMKEAKIHFALPSEPHQLSFSGLDADIHFDPLNLAGSEIIARVDVNTLATEDPGLTKHLLSHDFFDAEKYPVIKFLSTRIESGSEGTYLAHGALAMKDSVHAVVIPFHFETKEDRGLFKGSLELFAGDYGVMKKSEGSDKVVVTLEIPVNRNK